jgi:hypothetical protein
MSQYWVWFDGGLITQQPNPMGFPQGRDLAFFIELEF